MVYLDIEVQEAIDASLGDPGDIFDLDVEEEIATALGEPDCFDPELCEIAEKLEARELDMPQGWMIQISTGTPLQCYDGPQGRGYYPAGWTSAAIAWKIQQEEAS